MNQVRNNKQNTTGKIDDAKSVPVDRRDFWNGRAEEFSKYAASTGYPEAFIRILKPRRSWTVLDMGCGGGTIAIPLAKKVKSITAVDFSKRMLEIVVGRCRKGRITNVKTLQGSWEDEWDSLGIGVHDVAIASRSLIGGDPKSLISKLNGVAKNAVYISVAVGSGPFDKRLFESTGRKFKMGPDYVTYYNLLYEMGIMANVAFIPESHPNRWKSYEEAFEDQRWMFHGMTTDDEDRVQSYLKKNLLSVKGHLQLPYSRQCYWAVMFWTKSEKFELPH